MLNVSKYKYIHPIAFAKLASHMAFFPSHDSVFFLLFGPFPAHMNKSPSPIPSCFGCCSVDWCCTPVPLGLLISLKDRWLFSDTFWNFSPGKSLTLPLQTITPLSLTSQLLHLWNTNSFQPVAEAQLPHPQLEHLRLFSRTLASEGLNPYSFTSLVSFHVFCCSSGLCFRCKSTKPKADPQLIRFIHAFRWMNKDELACVSGSTEDHCERQKPHFYQNWFWAA